MRMASSRTRPHSTRCATLSSKTHANPERITTHLAEFHEEHDIEAPGPITTEKALQEVAAAVRPTKIHFESPRFALNSSRAVLCLGYCVLNLYSTCAASPFPPLYPTRGRAETRIPVRQARFLPKAYRCLGVHALRGWRPTLGETRACCTTPFSRDVQIHMGYSCIKARQA